MKKILTAVLAVSLLALMSCASKATTTETVKEPEVPAMSAAKTAAMAEEGALDLETFESADAWAIKYNKDDYTLLLNGCEFVQFKLATPMEAGDVITVHLTGTNEGVSGFRSWVVDDHQTTNSDPLYLDSIFDKLPQGDFDLTYTLNATNPSIYLFIKGPQWGTMLDKITLKSVAVTYN